MTYYFQHALPTDKVWRAWFTSNTLLYTPPCRRTHAWRVLDDLGRMVAYFIPEVSACRHTVTTVRGRTAVRGHAIIIPPYARVEPAHTEGYVYHKLPDDIEFIGSRTSRALEAWHNRPGAVHLARRIMIQMPGRVV